MIALRKKKPAKDEREARDTIRSHVTCTHCGETIDIQNVDTLAEEFAVRCPRCHRRSFLTRAYVQQKRRG